MKNIIVFVAGAVIGAGASYIFVKKQSEKTINEEVEAVKEYYRAKDEAIDEEAKKIARAAVQKPELEEMKEIAAQYTADEEEKPAPKKKSTSRKRKITYISPEEFEEDMDYAKETLNYYEEDQTLANEADEELSLEDTVGVEMLDHIGDYESEVCYVRNPKENTDYEVIVVHGSYAHIVGLVDEE